MRSRQRFGHSRKQLIALLTKTHEDGQKKLIARLLAELEGAVEISQ